MEAWWTPARGRARESAKVPEVLLRADAYVPWLSWRYKRNADDAVLRHTFECEGRALRCALQAQKRARAIANDHRTSDRHRSLAYQHALTARIHAELLCWLAATLLLQAGLERRVGFYLDETPGAALALWLIGHGVRPQPGVSVCDRCTLVFESTRPRKICDRRSSGVATPDGPAGRVFESVSGAMVGYERVQMGFCECGAWFVNVSPPTGGKPRTQCRECLRSAARARRSRPAKRPLAPQEFRFASPDSQPLKGVAFAWGPRGETVRFEAEPDGTIRTTNAEHAEQLRRMGLVSVPLRPPAA